MWRTRRTVFRLWTEPGRVNSKIERARSAIGCDLVPVSCLTETSNAHSLATLEPQQSRTSVTSTSSAHLNKALLPTLLVSSSMVSALTDHNINLEVQHDVSQTPSGSSIFLASINNTTHGILHQFPGVDFSEGMPKLAPNLPRHSGHSTVKTSSLTNCDSDSLCCNSNCLSL